MKKRVDNYDKWKSSIILRGGFYDNCFSTLKLFEMLEGDVINYHRSS